MPPAAGNETNPSVLLAEDDSALRDTLCLLFETEGFRVLSAADGQRGLELALLHRPSAIVTDLRLPGLSGAELCRRLRALRFDRPILVVSAIGDEVDKVLLLEMGADDYIVKPFGMRELIARVRAVMRRSIPDVDGVLRFADVEVDVTRRLVLRAGREVRLTPLEYRLLMLFIRRPDEALTREEILAGVWGYNEDMSTRTIDAHLARLRHKLERDQRRPRHFLTLHGVGYRFLP